MNGSPLTEPRPRSEVLDMNDSIVFYHDRNDVLHVVDPDATPHFEEHPPVFDIVCAVINAGYEGVVVDEKQLDNGQFLLGLSTNPCTPEGQIIEELVLAADDGVQMPSIALVLEQIKKQYDQLGGRNE
jgi:hypothetical protein